MAVKWGGELGANEGFEGLKEEISCFGNSSPNDDGVWVEQPAGVDYSTGKFLRYTTPDVDSDGVTLLGSECEVGWGACVKSACDSLLGVLFLGFFGDLAVADVVFEGAHVSVGSFASSVIDRCLA